jgi:tetratricopeptide (TPR) repeat protein
MPSRLTDAAGKAHQPVSTASKMVVTFYDQGLGWFHSYGFVDAIRAFHQALRYDPNLAMAELGLERSYTTATARKRPSIMLAQVNSRATVTTANADTSLRVYSWDTMNADHDETKFAKRDACRTELDELLRHYPDDAALWIARGNAEEYDPEGEGQDGHADWRRIHNLTLLGWAYEHVGRTDDAKRFLKEAFELPVEGRFQGLFDHVNYPNLLARRGAFTEATEAARRLTETAGNAGKAIGFAIMGQTLMNSGHAEEAQLMLMQAGAALRRPTFGSHGNRERVGE